MYQKIVQTVNEHCFTSRLDYLRLGKEYLKILECLRGRCTVQVFESFELKALKW
jgi:hypothetical protein